MIVQPGRPWAVLQLSLAQPSSPLWRESVLRRSILLTTGGGEGSMSRSMSRSRSRGRSRIRSRDRSRGRSRIRSRGRSRRKNRN